MLYNAEFLVQALIGHLSDIVRVIFLFALWYIASRASNKALRHVFDAAIQKIPEGSSGTIARDAIIQRLKTIRQLITQLSRVVIGLLMGFWILGSVGIDVRPIIAGIGVVGIAVSLAAQNVIRDFINGILILIEDQYNVGDWVEIGKLSGSVEKFTLRVTRLRDFDGNMVVIPNSTIQTVVNYTKIWSVAVVKVGITYESDYRKALRIMQDLADEMAEKEGTFIIETPVVQGITEFAENSVNMRAMLKTSPGMQWNVGREYRMRLKERFDRDNIEFAYPQVVVHKVD